MSYDRSWSTVALTAVLITAAETTRRRRARARGADPTAELPPHVTRGALREARDRAALQLHRWQIGLAARDISGAASEIPDAILDDTPEVASHPNTGWVDVLGILMAARHLEQAIGNMHQHLMGRFPLVDPGLVEEARVCRRELNDWIDEPGEDAGISGAGSARRLGERIASLLNATADA